MRSTQVTSVTTFTCDQCGSTAELVPVQSAPGIVNTGLPAGWTSCTLTDQAGSLSVDLCDVDSAPIQQLKGSFVQAVQARLGPAAPAVTA